MRGWLEVMRVKDAAVSKRAVAAAIKEPYGRGEGAWASLERCEREEVAWRSGVALPRPEALDADLAQSVRAHFRKRADSAGCSLAAATKASAGTWLWMAALTVAFAWSLKEWAFDCSLLGLFSMPVLGQLVAYSSRPRDDRV